MDGRKVILIMFAAVIAIAIVTYILYINTRKDEDLPRDNEGSIGRAVPLQPAGVFLIRSS